MHRTVLILGLVALAAACGGDDTSAGGDAAALDAEVDAAASTPHSVDRGDAAPVVVGTDPPLCTECDGSCAEAVEVLSAQHVVGGVQYDDTPPVGGLHDPCWADYGVYDAPSLAPERWVHNLEHGAVVFLYHCPDGCDDDRAALEAFAAALPRTIVTPYADMPSGFAAVAWGHRIVSSCLDLDAFGAFYEAHFDRAPESIATGAPSGC